MWTLVDSLWFHIKACNEKFLYLLLNDQIDYELIQSYRIIFLLGSCVDSLVDEELHILFMQIIKWPVCKNLGKDHFTILCSCVTNN
jgi:hypothetical protein